MTTILAPASTDVPTDMTRIERLRTALKRIMDCTRVVDARAEAQDALLRDYDAANAQDAAQMAAHDDGEPTPWFHTDDRAVDLPARFAEGV